MNFDKIIGIDPGSSGGIAIWTEKVLFPAVKKMPSLEELQMHLGEQKIDYSPICFIEKVSIYLSDSDLENRGKQFRIQKMMANYEHIKSSLTFHKIPYVEVHPLTWQAYLKLRQKGETKTQRKERYKRAAAQFFPGATITNYSADALCLVEFGIQKFNSDIEFIKEKLITPAMKLPIV